MRGSAFVEIIFDDHDLATGPSGTLRYVGKDVIQHRGSAS